MATTINRATLARQVNGEIEYIYPKTEADLVEYEAGKTVKEKIESMDVDTDSKVNAPLDKDGDVIDGAVGQVLESNGDGTTSWVTRARVYVGSGEMPEGYDVQIDPHATAIEIDDTLSKQGGIAEAKATGDAIARLEEAIENITVESDGNKVNAPLDNSGKVNNGKDGQVLETNGDGTTSWVTRARVYVGSDEMPEGYDVQIDPEATGIEIDNTLSKAGSVAEAKATGDAINKLNAEAKKIDNKVNIPVTNNAIDNGINGQVLETNGDGTTSWVHRSRVYVGSGEMPEGYDVQIDPEAASVEVDTTLTKEDAVAEAKATGEAINGVYDYINAAKDFTLLKDPVTGFVYIVKVENGQLVCISKCLSIAITTPPTKTQYSIGEIFNPAGMVVTATCEDGNTRTITKYGYPITPLQDGTESVPITYTENGVTFVAYVNISTSFDIEALLMDFTYVANGDGTYSITGWKGTLNGTPSTECVVPASEFVVVNPAN